MARYRGTIHGGRGATSRLGTTYSGFESNTNSWNFGIRVVVRAADAETDIFEVYRTGGSQSGQGHRIHRYVVKGGTILTEQSNG